MSIPNPVGIPGGSVTRNGSPACGGSGRRRGRIGMTFGDGESSTARNPSHVYADAGSYTITLTATSKEGGTDRASQGVTVAP